MKIVYAFLLLNALSANAQTNDKPVKLVHYVLDSFARGTVRLKSGQAYNQLLNYNLVTKEMIFDQNGKYLAIAHPEEVDTVYLNNRKFIPVDNAFYEWLTGSTYPLFLEHTCTIKEQGANTGFGRTNTTAATAVKALLKDGGAYALKLPDDYQVVPERHFYLRKNGRYYKLNNEQQVIKLFPEKKQVVRDWIKNNNVNFSRQRDVILLVQQIQ